MNNLSVEIHGTDLPWEVVLRSDIGGREEQQDCVYAYADPFDALAIVCDGMGGTENGGRASRIAVDSMRELFEEFKAQYPRGDTVQFLGQAMVTLDARVSQELGKQKGGTTAVAAILQDGKLYWFSVGDSRLYIFRNGELVQATRDHNYLLCLNEQLQRGEITQEVFLRELERGEALISFMGVGGLPVYDLTNAPLNLKEGDILLLTTDGLYKAIPQGLIQHILRGGNPLSEKADKLMTQIAVLKKTIVLDNTTFALIKINEGAVDDEEDQVR